MERKTHNNRIILENGGEYLLAEAIVAQAGKDYIEIKKEMYYAGELEFWFESRKELETKLNDIIRFFRSKYFLMLTDIDPDWLIETLKCQHEKWVRDEEATKEMKTNS